jgi:DNA transformation protein and related proteins
MCGASARSDGRHKVAHRLQTGVETMKTIALLVGPWVFASPKAGMARSASGIEMVASASFAEFLREQLAALGRVTTRRMFGKTGVFCDGVMFGMVRDNTLYFRVDDHNRAVFKEAQSFPPLNYEKGGCTIDLSFWRAPERLFDEPDELVAWARAALAAAHRVAAKREAAPPARKST